MRKLLFLFVLFVSPSIAQTVVPIVGGNATINMAQPNAGNAFKVFVTGSVTVNVSGQPTSSSTFISIVFTQDGTGHAVTFGGAFASASAPAIPTTASGTTAVSFQYDGTANQWYGIAPAGSSPSANSVFSAMVFIGGTGTDAQTIYRNKLAQSVVFPAAAPNSYAIAGTAATASTVYTFKKNGSSFATATFAISGTMATWTQASSSTFAPGDILEIDGPATADATLADVGITLVGVKQ